MVKKGLAVLPAPDAHAAGAQVPQAQDAFAIGDHHHLDFLLGVLLQQLQEAALVGGTQVEAVGGDLEMGILLARLAHGGGVCREHPQQSVNRGGSENMCIASSCRWCRTRGSQPKSKLSHQHGGGTGVPALPM